MEKVEVIRQIFQNNFSFPFNADRIELISKVSIEVDGKFTKHFGFEGKWQINKYIYRAQDYFSIHVSTQVYSKLNQNKVLYNHLIIDIDADNLKESTIQLIKILDILEKDLRLVRDKDFYVKYSGNKGYHIIIPFWKFDKLIVYEDLILLIKYKLKNFDIDWQLLDSQHHLIRDFWSYNPKGDKISLYLPKDEKISLLVVKYSKVEERSLDKIFELSNKLKQNIDFKPLTKKQVGLLNSLISEIKENKKLIEKLKEINKTVKKINQKPIKIGKGFFPKKVKEILNKGIQKDGRERFLFLLATICKANGYSYKEFEQLVKQWNEKNYRLDERDWNRWLKTLEHQMKWYKKNWDNLKYKIPSKNGKGMRYWMVE